MWDDFKAFYAAPFSQNMSATGWFLFIGMLLIIMILWQFVLKHVLME